MAIGASFNDDFSYGPRMDDPRPLAPFLCPCVLCQLKRGSLPTLKDPELIVDDNGLIIKVEGISIISGEKITKFYHLTTPYDLSTYVLIKGEHHARP